MLGRRAMHVSSSGRNCCSSECRTSSRSFSPTQGTCCTSRIQAAWRQASRHSSAVTPSAWLTETAMWLPTSDSTLAASVPHKPVQPRRAAAPIGNGSGALRPTRLTASVSPNPKTNASPQRRRGAEIVWREELRCLSPKLTFDSVRDNRFGRIASLVLSASLRLCASAVRFFSDQG